MRILILGYDGYLGWPLTNHLLNKGHVVAGIDDLSRRRMVHEVGSDSLIPIDSQNIRIKKLSQRTGFSYCINHSLGYDSATRLRSILNLFKPDIIVHLAEQPSAPWSMRSVHHAVATQHQNVLGTLHLLWAMKEVCPEAHLVKLGTMGEYGTPNCDIPEGEIPANCDYNDMSDCPMADLQFPRSAGSFYHLSKVHDTHNIIFACKTWGLRSTDIMQGVVFGVLNGTRFDYDQYFGTAINRFCAQAISGIPLTVYGEGGQTRGFLTIGDSRQCLTLAIENPPAAGEYRTFNQYENIYRVIDLAGIVKEQAKDLGIECTIEHIPNPRLEAERHYYNPTHKKLFDLGYVPTTDIDGEIRSILEIILPYKDRVIKEVIMPTTKWR